MSDTPTPIVIDDLAWHVERDDGFCPMCSKLWPCDTIRARDEIIRLTAEVERLNTLVARLVELPGEHRDSLLDNPPLKWSSKSMDVARDTCDVIGWKLRDAKTASEEGGGTDGTRDGR